MIQYKIPLVLLFISIPFFKNIANEAKDKEGEKIFAGKTHNEKLVAGTFCLKAIGRATAKYVIDKSENPFEKANDFNELFKLLDLASDVKNLIARKKFKFILAKKAPFKLKKMDGASPVLLLLIDESTLVLYDKGFVRKIENDIAEPELSK